MCEEIAEECATVFADTTQAGAYSHGVNRFPRFIQQLENGDIVPEAVPTKVLSLGAIEQWDAHQAIGNLTAKKNDGQSGGAGFAKRHRCGGIA